MGDATVVALLAALIWKLTDFAKHLTNRDLSSVLTQVVAWTAGFGAIVLFAHSGFAPRLTIHGINLARASGVDQLLFGLTIGSTGSSLYDFKRAIDGSDSAATPPLIPVTPAATRRPRRA